VFDNGSGTAQDPGRPAITGANVNNVITRCQEMQNWLLSAAGSFTNIFQVETATAVGTIAGTGNATVVVTAFQMNNSPKTISVAVTSGDTAATWAGKVRTALAADVDVSAWFTVSGAGASIVLTTKTAAVFGNDPTMNVSLANGTSTGITAAPTSANTTAGVAPRQGTAYLNTVMQCSSYGSSPVVLADAQNFVTRCGELVTNYQASANTNLNTLLTPAVNPNQNLA
jgi:phage tail sheath gpL-like